MDWLTFISSIIDALAWPIIFLIALIIFRKPTLKILASIKLLRYQDLEIELEEEIGDLKKKTKEIEKKETKSSVKEEDLSIDNKIKEVAEVSPSASIILAWKEIEKELKSAVERSEISSSDKEVKSSFQYIKLLDYNGLIEDSTYHFLNELRSIRNTIIHTSEKLIKLDRDSAIDYIHMARIARRSLKNIET